MKSWISLFLTDALPNTPTDTFGLLDGIKSNLYKVLKNYFEVIKKEVLIVVLLDKKITFANNNKRN